MPVIITNDSRDVLLREDHMPTEQQLSSSQIIEGTHSLQYDFGEARFHELYFDGFQIGYGDAHVYENLHVEVTDTTSLVSLHFMLRGQFITSMQGIGKPCEFSSLEHNLLYAPEAKETADIKKQRGIEMVGLGITKGRFLELAENNGRILGRLAENIAGNKPVLLNWRRNQPITNRMLKVLDEVRHCSFQGGLKKLYLQSKVLELLALQCEQYEQAEGNRENGVRMTATDKERIYYARDLLLASAQEPPSLHELARKAGINEFKLKTGFKAVFDDTVFGYLNNYRLDQAQRLLQSGRSLSDIADELGYSSPQHFCNAFKKKFGISPGRARSGL